MQYIKLFISDVERHKLKGELRIKFINNTMPGNGVEFN
jgi:hypothetical protein